MPTRRQFIATGARLVAAPSLLPLVAACGVGSRSGSGGPDLGASSGTMQVAWWGGNDRAERTQKVMDLFSNKYPQWKFTSQFTNFFAYWDKINTQAAGGALPDIFQMDMRYIGQFASKQLIADLARFADNALNLGDFDAGLLDQGKISGGLYGVPLGGIVEASLYDLTAIQQAGLAPPTGQETWADFAAYCEKLSKTLPKGTWASDDESVNMDPFEVFIRQRNKELYTPDGKASFSRQDMVDWFQYWADLREPGPSSASPPRRRSLRGRPASWASSSPIRRPSRRWARSAACRARPRRARRSSLSSAHRIERSSTTSINKRRRPPLGPSWILPAPARSRRLWPATRCRFRCREPRCPRRPTSSWRRPTKRSTRETRRAGGDARDQAGTATRLAQADRH